MRAMAMAMRVAGDKEGEGGKVMAMVTRVVGKQCNGDKESVRVILTTSPSTRVLGLVVERTTKKV